MNKLKKIRFEVISQTILDNIRIREIEFGNLKFYHNNDRSNNINITTDLNFNLNNNGIITNNTTDYNTIVNGDFNDYLIIDKNTAIFQKFIEFDFDLNYDMPNFLNSLSYTKLYWNTAFYMYTDERIYPPHTHKLIYDFTPYDTVTDWVNYLQTIPNSSSSAPFYSGGTQYPGIFNYPSPDGFISIILPSGYNNLEVTFGNHDPKTNSQRVELLINDVVKSTAYRNEYSKTYTQKYIEGDILKIIELDSQIHKDLIIKLTNVIDTNPQITPSAQINVIDTNYKYLYLTYDSNNDNGNNQTEYNLNIPSGGFGCDILLVGGGGTGHRGIQDGGAGGAVVYETTYYLSTGLYTIYVAGTGKLINDRDYLLDSYNGTSWENDPITQFSGIKNNTTDLFILKAMGAKPSNNWNIRGNTNPSGGTRSENIGNVLNGVGTNLSGGGDGYSTKGQSGNAQDGPQVDITGVNTYYAGGGGGGNYSWPVGGYTGTGGSGGQGGGANGARWGNGVHAASHSGGGGGGAGNDRGIDNRPGGLGGSGVVIIRYKAITTINEVITTINESITTSYNIQNAEYGNGTYEIDFSTSSDITNNIPYYVFLSNNNDATWENNQYDNGEYIGKKIFNNLGYYGDWITIKMPVNIIPTKIRFVSILLNSSHTNKLPKKYRLYGYFNNVWELILDDYVEDYYEYETYNYIHNIAYTKNIQNAKNYNKYALIVNKIGTANYLAMSNFEIFGREIINDKLINIDISSDPVITPTVPINILDDNYKYIVFQNTGDNQSSYNITFTESTVCDILIVGGGGSGGRSMSSNRGGGGGGAGGLIYITSTILPADTYTLKVGNGGLGTSSGQNGYNSSIISISTTTTTTTTTTSSFTITTPTINYLAYGGGRGGNVIGGDGSIGGSGGGGSDYNGSGGISINGGGVGTTYVYGFNGGDARLSSGYYSGGSGAGGGGAGSLGQNASGYTIGYGGSGKNIDISGTLIEYAKGGDGGLYGGGTGTNGEINKGNGGAGAGRNGTQLGGNGGSGIIIIKIINVPVIITPLASHKLELKTKLKDDGDNIIELNNTVLNHEELIHGIKNGIMTSYNMTKYVLFKEERLYPPYYKSEILLFKNFFIENKIYGNGQYNIDYSSTDYDNLYSSLNIFRNNYYNGVWQSNNYKNNEPLNNFNPRSSYIGTSYLNTGSDSHYKGEWITIKLPYKILLTKIIIALLDSNSLDTSTYDEAIYYFPHDFGIYGKNNDDENWKLIIRKIIDIDYLNNKYDNIYNKDVAFEYKLSDNDRLTKFETFENYGLVVSQIGGKEYLNFSKWDIYGRESTSIIDNKPDNIPSKKISNFHNYQRFLMMNMIIKILN